VKLGLDQNPVGWRLAAPGVPLGSLELECT